MCATASIAKKVLDFDKLHEMFLDEGCFSKLPGYEYRKVQMQMLEMIVKAFNADTFAVVEAGTGTGKSIAYLLPSIYWAVKHKEKIVISTNTINLQEQLMFKDIPLLKNVLTDTEFEAVLVKGRNNYICLNRLRRVLSPEQGLYLDPGLNDQINKIFKIVDGGGLKEGTKSELGFIPDYSLWDSICSSSDHCMGNDCKHIGKCFFYEARKLIKEADILVVNHHILCSDLSVREALELEADEKAVLPGYERLIIDEAHNFEDVVTDCFSSSISKQGFKQLFGSLHRAKKDKNNGILHRAKRLIDKYGFESGNLDNKSDEAIATIDKLVEAIPNIASNTDHLFQDLYSKVVLELNKNKDFIGMKLRFVKPFIDSNSYIFKELSKVCNSLYNSMDAIFSLMNDQRFKNDIPKEFRYPIKEVGSVLTRLGNYVTCLNKIMNLDTLQHVCWSEVSNLNDKNSSINVKMVPLYIGDLLKSALYDKMKTIVFTSATLSSHNSFNFFYDMLGLRDVKKLDAILKSPFNYGLQSVFCVPTDIPDPRAKEYQQMLNYYIGEIVKLTRGSTLILFTSYKSLKDSHAFLQGMAGGLGINLLCHGDMPRTELLDRFKSTPNSVLLGTDSFWEGIDVVGDALRYLIIAKLPFFVPSEPIHQARSDLVKSKGYNPFMDYALPYAILKLKQGFGRLIRSKTDKGFCICMDSRLYTKNYGTMFVSSLPEPTVIYGDYNKNLSSLYGFLLGK